MRGLKNREILDQFLPALTSAGPARCPTDHRAARVRIGKPAWAVVSN